MAEGLTIAGDKQEAGTTSFKRSNRREVRNPILSLPAAQTLQNLPPEAQDALRALLKDIVTDARRRAQESWLKNKGPMAAYWKAVGAYAEHARRVLLGAA